VPEAPSTPKEPERPPEQPSDGPRVVDKTASAPILKEKWNLDYAEKTWGLKFKGFKYIEVVTPSRVASLPDFKNGSFHLLLEFTKDLKGQDLQSLKTGFNQTSQVEPYDVEFVVIDEDNVIVSKILGPPAYKGEVTGVKGDAFWLIFRDNLSGSYILPDLKVVKRVELRPRQK
jgi:hypothetical protein